MEAEDIFLFKFKFEWENLPSNLPNKWEKLVFSMSVYFGLKEVNWKVALFENSFKLDDNFSL